jgi:prepilin-type N-terminal cleavage/methylation domain-containing protein
VDPAAVRPSGFALVEVIVGLTVLAVGLAGCFALLHLSARTLARAEAMEWMVMQVQVRASGLVGAPSGVDSLPEGVVNWSESAGDDGPVRAIRVRPAGDTLVRTYLAPVVR